MNMKNKPSDGRNVDGIKNNRLCKKKTVNEILPRVAMGDKMDFTLGKLGTMLGKLLESNEYSRKREITINVPSVRRT
jgi:hypothetical protein